MEHNLHNPSLHWGYSAAPPTPQNHWAPPPQSRSNKRSISESDCEELYSEESSKEQISPGEPGSCQLLSRKKRRGVIEKKRRDRINSSLSELKRLVPSAYEKQGSAKLEKAEILQLTVEHLKSLHSKGIDTLSYDPQRFAMDYHIIGFRECAAEVARYLVTIEGMDIQDPLRLRLMSHLQYFVQQRELSAKSCASPSSWAAAPPTTGLTYQPNCSVSPYHTYASQSTHSVPSTSSYVPNLSSTSTHGYHPTLSSTPPIASTMHQQQQQQQATPVHVSRPSSSSVTAASNDSMTMLSHTPSQQQQPQQVQPTQQIQPQAQGIQQQTQQPHATHEAHHQQHYTQEQAHTHSQEHQTATYIELTNSQDHSAHRNPALTSANPLSYGGSAEYPVGSSQAYSPNSGLNYVAANGSKPYRPWGAEMAY